MRVRHRVEGSDTGRELVQDEEVGPVLLLHKLTQELLIRRTLKGEVGLEIDPIFLFTYSKSSKSLTWAPASRSMAIPSENRSRTAFSGTAKGSDGVSL